MYAAIGSRKCAKSANGEDAQFGITAFGITTRAGVISRKITEAKKC